MNNNYIFTCMSDFGDYGFTVKRYSCSPNGDLIVNHEVFMTYRRGDELSYERVANVDTVGNFDEFFADIKNSAADCIEYTKDICQALQKILGDKEVKTNDKNT